MPAGPREHRAVGRHRRDHRSRDGQEPRRPVRQHRGHARRPRGRPRAASRPTHAQRRRQPRHARRSSRRRARPSTSSRRSRSRSVWSQPVVHRPCSASSRVLVARSSTILIVLVVACSTQVIPFAARAACRATAASRTTPRMSTCTPSRSSGSGIMGAPMAGHLLAAGHALTSTRARRRRPSRCSRRARRGPTRPPRRRRGADVVFLCVPDTPDVERRRSATDGVLRRRGDGRDRRRPLDDLPRRHPRASPSAGRRAADQAPRRPGQRRRRRRAQRHALDHGRRRRGGVPGRPCRCCSTWARRSPTAAPAAPASSRSSSTRSSSP